MNKALITCLGVIFLLVLTSCNNIESYSPKKEMFPLNKEIRKTECEEWAQKLIPSKIEGGISLTLGNNWLYNFLLFWNDGTSVETTLGDIRYEHSEEVGRNVNYFYPHYHESSDKESQDFHYSKLIVNDEGYVLGSFDFTVGFVLKPVKIEKIEYSYSKVYLEVIEAKISSCNLPQNINLGNYIKLPVTQIKNDSQKNEEKIEPIKLQNNDKPQLEIKQESETAEEVKSDLRKKFDNINRDMNLGEIEKIIGSPTTIDKNVNTDIGWSQVYYYGDKQGSEYFWINFPPEGGNERKPIDQSDLMDSALFFKKDGTVIVRK